MVIIRQKRWLEKPPLGGQLNWGHPLATGLILCMPLNEYGPNWNNRAALPVVFDACGRFKISFTSAGSDLVYNTPGPGWNFPATNRFFLVPDLASTDALSIPTDQVTCLFIRRKTDSTLRAACHFGVTTATLANRCGIHAPYSDGNMYFDFGGASGNNRLTVSGESWGTAVDYLAVTAGQLGLAAYRNGRKIGASGTPVTRSRTAGEDFQVNAGHNSNGDLEDVFFFAVANVAWDDSLVQWWMEEPYGMFLPQSPVRRYFVPAAAAGAGVLIHKGMDGGMRPQLKGGMNG